MKIRLPTPTEQAQRHRTRTRRRRLVVVASIVLSTAAFLPGAALGSDTSTRWTGFSESSGCAKPYTRTPYASTAGFISGSEPVLGPFGTYFGRTIGDIRDELVHWTVPGGGGRRVRVNPVMLPALTQVSQALVEAANNGLTYSINDVGGFSPRTIGNSYQISRHALGLGIDINPGRNPYRADGVLITDMPSWFVDIWRDAGFCWGGDWKDIKDPMHFSWIGPLTEPWLSPFAPRTNKRSFYLSASHQSEFGPVIGQYSMAVVDATGNGAPDIAGLRAHQDGAVLDIASSNKGYGDCSVERWFVPDTSVDDADHILMADFDTDSRQDLIALTNNGETLNATTATRAGKFKDLTSGATGLSSSTVAITGADFDGDRVADLWAADDDGVLRVWGGPTWTDLIHKSTLGGGAPSLMAAGDRDVGDTPELFLAYPEGKGFRVDVLTLAVSWQTVDSIAIGREVASLESIGASDFDGDGRADVQLLFDTGSMDVYVGNTSTGAPAARWFLRPNWECQGTDIPLSYSGSFYDDDDSIFESSIESIASNGVTRGCNPPYNDRFCSKDDVTREMMAAFLVRALGLTEISHPGFIDVAPDSTFAADIAKLATAGITKGCNPPDNNRFCPKDDVTREIMAAFLDRAGLGG